MKRFMLFVFLVVQFNLNAIAEEKNIYTLNDDVFIYMNFYDEDSQEWMIEEIKIPHGMLQEKTQTWVFNNESDFKAKIESIQKTYQQEEYHFINEYVVTEDKTKNIWETKFYWDLSWEKKFSEWIEKDIDKSFFSKHQISTDCADAMIALRWIFSRIHGLAVGTTLAGSGVLFTNESFKNAWNGLSRDEIWYKDQVFLATIDYIMDNAYTNSLWGDSFPVAINEQHLHAGTFFLYKTLPESSGHTQIILRTKKKLIIAESTVPRRVRDLMVRNFYPSTPLRNYSGLRTFKWLRKENNGKKFLLAGSDHPHYSEEQYDEELTKEFGEFYNAVFHRLKLKYNFKKHLRRLKKILTSQLESRVLVVNEGLEICANENCSPGTANYENWSTPSRDKRIKETFQSMNRIIESHGNKCFKKRFSNYLKNKKLRVSIKKGSELKIKFKELKNIFEKQLYSSEPNAPLLNRWGFSPSN